MSTAKRFAARVSRLVPGLLFLLMVAGSAPLAADRTRQSAPPSDSSDRPVRVERASTPAGDSSSGSVASQGSGSSRSSGAARTRSSSSGGSSAGPTRVEHRRGGSGFRGHGSFRGHHRHFSFYYGYPYWGSHWGPYYSWYWPWWWDRPYYGRYPGYGYPGYGYGRYEDELGALDLDLAPERAQVYLDGELIGEADDFDGFPSYLWLPKGTYDLVFYRDGYETIARQYSVYPGVVIDVRDRMVPGPSMRPEDLVSKSTVNREERLRRDRERQEEARAAEGRVVRPEAAPEEPYDVRGEPGRLALAVSPEDASVYLDGRLLGAAAELRRLHAGLIVDPGSHRLEVVRPGYRTKATDFEVEAGEEVTVEVDLERETG